MLFYILSFKIIFFGKMIFDINDIQKKQQNFHLKISHFLFLDVTCKIILHSTILGCKLP